MPTEVPLINVQRKYGGNIGEFGGWLTSMDYGNPMEEHMAARTKVAVFDVSHMGRYVIEGKDAFKFLQKLVSKDLSSVEEGFMSGPVLLLNENGGIIDDIMLYKLREDRWLAVVNAPKVRADLEWMLKWRDRWGMDVRITNVTTESVLIAIQGPESPRIMEEMGLSDVKDLKILQFVEEPELLGSKAVLVSRSGWTGEEVRSYGFEVWCDIGLGSKVLEFAVEKGAKPAGLIARDSLRLEAGYLLSGVDMNEEINPIEARYWLAITLGKEDCVGCDEVLRAYENGVSKVRVGFRLKKKSRIIPRHGYKVFAGSEEIGYVTSGTYSPLLKRPIGMGYVRTTHAFIGFKVGIEARGEKHEAKLVDPPFI